MIPVWTSYFSLHQGLRKIVVCWVVFFDSINTFWNIKIWITNIFRGIEIFKYLESFSLAFMWTAFLLFFSICYFFSTRVCFNATSRINVRKLVVTALLESLVLKTFFLLGFSFTDTDDSQDSRRREGTIFYSTLPLPPAREHSEIYLQLCMWDDYHIFLIATLVFTRLLLDGIYHLIELPFDWLMMWH